MAPSIIDCDGHKLGAGPQSGCDHRHSKTDSINAVCRTGNGATHPVPANKIIRRPCGARCLSITRMKQIRLLAIAARARERGCLASPELERHPWVSNRIIVTTVTALPACRE